MAKEKKKVPNLRFKGFTDDWEQRKLGEVFSILKNNTLSRANLSDEHGAAQDIHYGDILTKFNETLDISTTAVPYIQNEEVIEKTKATLLKIGDIVLADTAEDETAGKCTEIVGLVNQKVFAGLHTIPLRPNQSFSKGFLGFYMNSIAFHDQLKSLMQGIKVLSISKKALKETVISFPHDLREQEKIGQHLSNIDTLIALHQRKLVLLKQLKKGLLQKMFADKDSKRPVLRFEGFNDDWERWKLGDLVVIKSGLSTNTQSRQGFYKITRIETISKGLIDMNKTGSVQIKPDDKYLMHAGDILFSNINSLKHIGKVAIFNGKSTLYHGMNLLRMTAQSNVSSYFIYYQLITDKHSNWAKAHANPAVSQASINQHTLSLEPMYITKLEEQHEISDFIGKLDSILTFQQQKLVRINKIKKSLLQQIFI